MARPLRATCPSALGGRAALPERVGSSEGLGPTGGWAPDSLRTLEPMPLPKRRGRCAPQAGGASLVRVHSSLRASAGGEVPERQDGAGLPKALVAGAPMGRGGPA